MRNPTHPSVVLRLDGLAVTLASIVLYRELGMSWWVFVLACGLALVIAWLTVSWQAIRAATANPVEALRYE